MGKSKNETTFWNELLAVGLYKRNQGRLVRQLTAVALVVIVFLGAWSLRNAWLLNAGDAVKIGVPAAIFIAGAWFSYRLVNYPRFADFLIAVEGEIDKVSWASWPELYRSTVVVIGAMLFLGAVLFVYDTFWQWLFNFVIPEAWKWLF